MFFSINDKLSARSLIGLNTLFNNIIHTTNTISNFQQRTVIKHAAAHKIDTN